MNEQQAIKSEYDVVIIGGGINGCGCAADASLRGLSVLLCEQDDLASKTSSASTKLIHGGLRYLEMFDFSMVKKALDERQRLISLAPHLIHSMPFVLPCQNGLRSPTFLRLGLFLYDRISMKNKFPRSSVIKRVQKNVYFNPLKKEFKKGFIYYDAVTDDTRLTIENAIQARNHGATILTGATLKGASTNNNQWNLQIQSNEITHHITTKAVINTTGPWVEETNALLNIKSKHQMSLVKGSHLVLPQVYEGSHAYVLQHRDRRIIFAIPYHGQTLVGTTDVLLKEKPEHLEISPEEIQYLLDIINTYFNHSFKPSDIQQHWSGMRPLLQAHGKPAKTISRDYRIDTGILPAPYIAVYGGKITTYRQLAAKAVDHLKGSFETLASSQTHQTPLPGAQCAHMNFEEYKKYAFDKYAWLDSDLLTRYLETYGTQTEFILSGCSVQSALGVKFAQTVYQAEIDYLVKHEWANALEDILWRRGKLGFLLNPDAQQKLGAYLLNRPNP